MVKYAKKVPGTDNQALQHFISNSPWDEKPVIMRIQDKVIQLIGDENNGSLHFDESGYKKMEVTLLESNDNIAVILEK